MTAPSPQVSRGVSQLVSILVTAIEFFTRIPRPSGIAYDSEHARCAPAFAPVVGWLVGATVAAVAVLASALLPPTLSAIAAVGAGVLLTGALHEDGLADVCDAMGATQPARALEIMKDSRIGTYGTLGLCLSTLARVAALAVLLPALGVAALALSLVTAHAMSRLAGLCLSLSLPYVRREEDASARDFVQRPPASLISIGIAAGLLPLLLLGISTGAMVAWLLPALILTWLWLRRVFARRIGGWTGDCVGCMQQACELVCLLGLCAVFAR